MSNFVRRTHSDELRDILSERGIEHWDDDCGTKEQLTEWNASGSLPVLFKYRQDHTCGHDFLYCECVTDGGLRIDVDVTPTDWKVRIPPKLAIGISERVADSLKELLTTR